MRKHWIITLMTGLMLLGLVPFAYGQKAYKQTADSLFAAKKYVDAGFYYDSVAFAYFHKRDFDAALAAHLEVLAYRKMYTGTNTPAAAETYSALGKVYQYLGDYKAGISYLDTALAIHKQLGLENERTKVMHNNIANAFTRTGQLDLAHKHINWSMNFLKENENFKSLANALAMKGDLSMYQSAFDRALDFYQQSYSIRAEVLGEHSPVTVKTHIAIAAASEALNEFGKAILHYRKALSYYRGKEGYEDKVGEILHNMGIVLQRQGNSTQAEAYLDSAMLIREKVGNPYKSALTFSEQVVVYGSLGKMEKVEEIVPKAERLFEASIKGTSTHQLRFCNNVAYAYYANSNYKKAIEFYNKALNANYPGFTEEGKTPQTLDLQARSANPLVMLKSLQGKSAALMAAGKNQEAMDLVVAASRLAGMLKIARTSTWDKLRIGGISLKLYMHALTSHYRLSRENPGQGHLQQAFYFSEKSKASTLSQYIDGLGVKDEVLRSLQGRIENTGRKLTESIQDPTLAAVFRDSLLQLHEKYSTYLQEHPQPFQDGESINVAQLQNNYLQQNQAIVAFQAVDSVLYIFTLTPDAFYTDTVGVQARKLNGLINRFRAVCAGGHANARRFARYGYRLYQKTLAPVAPHLSKHKVEDLVIIPSDSLQLVPYEALLASKPQARRPKFGDLDYLVRHYAISTHYSATLWAHGQDVSRQRTYRKNLLAMAPVFDPSKMNTLSFGYYSPENSPGRGRIFKGNQASPLPATRDEVEMLSKMARTNGYQVNTFLYGKASEVIFKHEAPHYSYIALATHGKTDFHYPERSSLLFAPPKGLDTLTLEEWLLLPAAADNGLLHADELSRLKLQADLMTLSACEMGYGQIYEGEGIIAYNAAVLQAGVPHIVFGLWKVPDEETKDLMVAFWKHVFDGKSYSKALQLAKRKLLETNPNIQPKHWAGMVVID